MFRGKSCLMLPMSVVDNAVVVAIVVVVVVEEMLQQQADWLPR